MIQMASHDSSAINEPASRNRSRLATNTTGNGQLRLVRPEDVSRFGSDGDEEKRMSPDPGKLMEEVANGDLEAFRELVEVLWSPTLKYVYHLTGGDVDHAHDIVQVTFTRLWEARSTLSNTGAVKVWLLRTARNLAVVEHRRMTARIRWHSGSADGAHTPRTPLEEAEGSELRMAIDRAVRNLSPRRRESFTLCHLQGLTYRDAAEVMGIRQQSVANHLQAAVAELREALAPFYQTTGSPDDIQADRQSPDSRSQ